MEIRLMTLAQRIRDQRYAKGWGPDELASRASISRTALYQIESGKTEQPRAATVRRIAEALNIPTETLLGPHLGMVSVNSWNGSELTTNLLTPPRTSSNSEEDSAAIRFRFDPSTNVSPRERELERKFHELLKSPFRDGVARILEESHRFLPQSNLDSGI